MVDSRLTVQEEVKRVHEVFPELWDAILTKERIAVILDGLHYEDIYALLLNADLPVNTLQGIVNKFQDASESELSQRVSLFDIKGHAFASTVKDITLCLSNHPHVTPAILASMLESAKLVNSSQNWVSTPAYLNAAANPILKGSYLEFYVKESQGYSYPGLLQQGLSRNPSMTEEMFEILFREIGPGAVEYSCSNASIPRKYVDEILFSGSITAIKNLASNRALTEEDFEAIRTHYQKTEGSDRALGLNPSLPDSMLFEHSYLNMERALKHPNVPLELLIQTIVLENEYIDLAVHNPRTPIQYAAGYLCKLFDKGALEETPELHARCDQYLKSMSYDEETLSSLPLRMKLELAK